MVRLANASMYLLRKLAVEKKLEYVGLFYQEQIKYEHITFPRWD